MLASAAWPPTARADSLSGCSRWPWWQAAPFGHGCCCATSSSSGRGTWRRATRSRRVRGAVRPLGRAEGLRGLAAGHRRSAGTASPAGGEPGTDHPVDGLGDRYLPDERLATPVERFLQTYEINLSAFAVPVPRPGAGPSGLESVTIRFEGSGSAYLDDLGFEPAVTP